MNKTSDKLLEFETRELVVRYFQGKGETEVNAWKVYEVTSNFIQGQK